jgi:hypothetical protein
MTIESATPAQTDPIVKCAYCGKEGPHRMHSSVYECQACWDWRKLDSAATRYWLILSKMVSSSVDAYDQMTYFPKVLGLSKEEVKAFADVINKMHDKTVELAAEHHVEERWTEQAQELFDQLANGIRPKPE